MGNCTAGDSAIEPYMVAHNLLLCHAAAVKLYKRRYQAAQKGLIGTSIATTWYVPVNKSLASLMAAARAKEFMFGWFIEPITYGRYPRTMRDIVGSRLPKFTNAQSKMLQGSIDFVGINYYCTNYAANDVPNNAGHSYISDYHATLTRLGDVKNSSSWTVERLVDKLRIKYISKHIAHLYKSIRDGGNVKGYFVWSFLDDFEWNSGYTPKYGLVHVDYANHLKRTLKASAKWCKKFLAKSK